MKIDKLLQEWNNAFEYEIAFKYADETTQYNIEMLSELIDAINEFSTLARNA